MNLSELEAAVFRGLDESQTSPVYWSQTDVDAALNEGVECLAEASEYNELSETLGLTAARTYYNLKALLTVADRFLRVTRIWNPVASRWMEIVTIRELDEETYARWERTPGEPQNAIIRGLWWLGIFPRPTASTGTLTVYFAALPVPLALPTDTPGFPQEWHRGIVHYALYDLLAQSGETAKAIEHFKHFLEYQAGLVAYVKQRMRKDRVGVIGA